MSDRFRVLALEPYYGGSHRAVLDLLVEHCDAQWDLMTLPARKWKWRMRGAAITMAQDACAVVEQAGGEVPWDVVFASTFINLAEWRGLVSPRIAAVPAIVYFHENQLLYPNRHVAEWDLQFPLTNVTSALSSQRCVFNSRWNLEGFLAEIPGFIKGFPDHHPKGVAERIRVKSCVLSPPYDPTPFESADRIRGERVRIIWPHRWEHDKRPEEFFAAVGLLAQEGLDFEVVVAGQTFAETRGDIRDAAAVLGARLVHCDEPENRQAYAELLASADIAVSTAANEFFGIAMMEACCAGCYPLVPDRLAYTELYEPRFRYSGTDELVARLRALILERPAPGAARSMAQRHTHHALVPQYERLLREVALEVEER